MVIVMFVVIEETAQIGGLLTIMTLMTVICGGFLEGGGYVFRWRWIASTIRETGCTMLTVGFC